MSSVMAQWKIDSFEKNGTAQQASDPFKLSRSQQDLRSAELPANSTAITAQEADDAKLNRMVAAQLNKTKLCAMFARGSCNDRLCRFAHSQTELRSPPDLTKTAMCRAFARGQCHDKNCRFAHGEQELRVTPNVYKTQLCNFFERGHCKKGDRCRHAHGVSELRSFAGDVIASDADDSTMSHLEMCSTSVGSSGTTPRDLRTPLSSPMAEHRMLGSMNSFTELPSQNSSPQGFPQVQHAAHNAIAAQQAAHQHARAAQLAQQHAQMAQQHAQQQTAVAQQQQQAAMFWAAAAAANMVATSDTGMAAAEGRRPTLAMSAGSSLVPNARGPQPLGTGGSVKTASAQPAKFAPPSSPMKVPLPSFRMEPELNLDVVQIPGQLPREYYGVGRPSYSSLNGAPGLPPAYPPGYSSMELTSGALAAVDNRELANTWNLHHDRDFDAVISALRSEFPNCPVNSRFAAHPVTAPGLATQQQHQTMLSPLAQLHTPSKIPGAMQQNMHSPLAPLDTPPKIPGSLRFSNSRTSPWHPAHASCLSTVA